MVLVGRMLFGMLFPMPHIVHRPIYRRGFGRPYCGMRHYGGMHHFGGPRIHR